LPTNQTTHNNHYIPQFYLKNWSRDGISIFTYSLLVPDSRIPYWSRKKIKSTQYKKHPRGSEPKIDALLIKRGLN
jgi:hypothetical protein